MAKESYTTRDVAKTLGVTPRTIQLWSESGLLDSWKTPGGHRRYDPIIVEAFVKDKKSKENYLYQEDFSSLNACKILIIEDDPMMLNLININIMNWDLPVKIELAQDGYDGLFKIGFFKPEILILDITLPSIDGFQIIATLIRNKLLSKMKIIVVSGMSSSEITESIKDIKDIDILQKPVDFKLLKSLITEHINSKKHQN